MFLGDDGVRSNFPRRFLKWVNKLGNWLLLLVLGLVLWVTVINPWYVRMRLEKFASSLQEADFQKALEWRLNQEASDSSYRIPVVSLNNHHPYQTGVVHFSKGGYVRFAFLSKHVSRGAGSVACFYGDHYKRFTKWNGWCCEMMLDHVEDLADLDRQLAELEQSE